MEQMMIQLSAPSPHRLQFVLLPAEDRFLHQDATHGARRETPQDDFIKFVLVVCNSAARATQGETRTDDRRQADRPDKFTGLPERGDESALRTL